MRTDDEICQNENRDILKLMCKITSQINTILRATRIAFVKAGEAIF